MDQRLADLQQQFQLERLEVNLFRGESRDTGSPQVFGGQVLGQALMAAHRTIDDGRVVHSLHAYFLRRGDFTKPIVYSVDRSRDGGSFSARRVVAVQNGEQIFICSASFQTPEKGLEYQAAAPAGAAARRAPAVDQTAARRRSTSCRRNCGAGSRSNGRSNSVRCSGTTRWRQWPARPCGRSGCARSTNYRTTTTLHHCLLAYISDYWLLDTSTMPHGSSFLRGNLVMASIDHAIWFHRPARVDDWLLYSLDSPSSSGARGFARGSFYSRDGVLVASTAQEGLIRLVQPQS